ncbi:geranylgeranyl reductase family protein [Archaeoglobus veneficus]|uniref:Geranylgeranyl reductase n=1 Tax=Archaeoglobus veneficus (strain DSM 11195 / SNP6) TaxID=693661 RepID=F2KTB9_ARCVS|nr:geranylgeranyl reductase family protein [Archaeoglobus veneficus]AEA47149.1 geranylgeranyl reductase [Archaeoglobus veneficus SNP6]
MDVDVAVAGVGVAGAFALRSLSKKLRVVGIDKRQKLGYPVECGEIIPTKKEMKELLPDLDDYSLFDIPKRFESNRTNAFNFVIPNGKTYTIDFEMHVLRRDEFIQTIAAESGHELLLGKRVSDFRNGELQLSSGEVVRHRVLIASDGANSKIAKKLNVWKYELASAKQYVMSGVECDEDVVYMYVGNKIAPGGYAWIIPKGDGIANVGVGIRQSFLGKGDSIHRVLDRFVKEYPYSSCYLKKAEIVGKIGAVAPVDRPLDKTVYGNVLLAGDSASMILSHVAAGIPTSMIAGDIAGRVINEYFEGGMELEEYDRLWRKAMIGAMERSYFIKSLWDRISENDRRLSRYFALINNRDMGLILRSRVPLKLKVATPFIPLLNLVF